MQEIETAPKNTFVGTQPCDWCEFYVPATHESRIPWEDEYGRERVHIERACPDHRALLSVVS